MLSAMFSHDPPTGVYSGMMPFSKSQQTNSGVLCPARLSSTGSTRKGGNRCARVGLAVRPRCQRSHDSRSAPASAGASASGSVLGIAASSCLSQPCKTSFVQLSTPLR